MFSRAPLVALLILAPATAALAATPRTEVPIQQSVLADGSPRYWVMLAVGGGEPARAMLDTGSTGLRVLAAAAPLQGVTRTGGGRSYDYTSGAQFSGVIAKARLRLGAAQSDDEVAFQLVEKVGCTKAKPDCPARQVPARDYRIGGRGDRGFTMILGTNTGQADAPNPLKALADRWIIELPRPGAAQPGRLILNPDDAELAGFSRVRLDPVFADLQGGFHDAVPGCVRVAGAAEPLCGPVLLDSGAPVVEIALGATTRARDAKPGARADLTIAPLEGPPLAAPFVVGRDKPSTLLIHPGQGQPRNRISAGSLPFYAFAVLYEPRARILGFKPRQPDTAATETP